MKELKVKKIETVKSILQREINECIQKLIKDRDETAAQLVDKFQDLKRKLDIADERHIETVELVERARVTTDEHGEKLAELSEKAEVASQKWKQERNMWQEVSQKNAELEKDIIKYENDILHLSRDLKTFGKHTALCGYVVNILKDDINKTCTCGFDEAYKRAEEWKKWRTCETK